MAVGLVGAAACSRLGPTTSPPNAAGSDCTRWGDSYFKEVPITQATIVPEGTSVRITGPGTGTDTTFAYYDDFLPAVGTGTTLRDFAGDLVYVGRAQDILFRRSDLPPLGGKVALLRGEFGGHGAQAADVGCLLPGSPGPAGARDRALVLVAHYDHLGIGAPDAAGDSIYHGFADNAAGVAMVLGIGEALARERREGRGAACRRCSSCRWSADWTTRRAGRSRPGGTIGGWSRP